MFGCVCGDYLMQIDLPLNEMTVAEKLQAMEVLWDDLRRHAETVPSPAWHHEVLADRERQLEEGQVSFLSLEEFRRDIEKKLP
jgi:hypothetical protein